ncbi:MULTISPECIES: helix-turn-helix domain-containing protein [Metallosphaera]|uniref:helix-turn-helix domain-containing protein n=1 Tax=Metallosphaera TaxID=41980 RepID=UPI001F070D50|nr:helix-turn-helix domain-containing protein [Metallosphaera sedula]MCH1770409.1 helix-turn-helix domain-containing protein [Metallosphaera sedula]MCP6727757.1 helix-turn-helix domain-containing protein [Metallosphaera sedula]
MYSRYPLKLVTVDLLHEGCWTSFLDNKVQVIAHHSNGHVVRDLVVGKPDSFKVIKRLDRSTRINSISNVSYLDDGRVLVDMMLDYRNSVFSLLDASNLLVVEPTIVYGNEIWSFLAYEYQVNEVLRELRGISRVNEVRVQDFDGLELSEEELEVLSTALEMGYFNVPREVNLKDVARATGKSVNAVAYSLRSGERKIIRGIMELLKKWRYLPKTW